MLLLKIHFLITFFIFNSFAYENRLTSNEAKLIAGNYFKSQSKLNTKSRLTYDLQDTFFKKSYLIRVNYTNLMDVPARLIAVDFDKKAKELTTDGDLKTFLTELNVLIKQESLNIKNKDEAKQLVKKLINIYGIYESDIKCQTSHNAKMYTCKVNNSSPRKFAGELSVDNYGLINFDGR